MSELQVNEFASRELLDQNLAKVVAEKLAAAIKSRGKAVLVVSGGSTPINFFQLLSRESLEWPKVTITLADERWVENGDDASNEKMLRDKLLVNCASEADFLALKTADENAELGAVALDAKLRELGTFDVLILGMGGDGHTASLFPGADALELGLDRQSGKSCLAVQPLTAPHQRISMTLPRLLDAQQIIIHITGNEKMQVLRKAEKLKDPALLPISSVLLQDETPVTVYWAN